MSEQCYLGIDLGAESGRVVAGLWNGSTIRIEELHRFPNGGIPIRQSLCWDVLRLWGEIQNGLAIAGKRFGKSVRSAGVDTWAIDYVLLSQSGGILGLPHHYRDVRTRGIVEETTRRVPRGEIFASSGIQFMELNTLFQLLALQRDQPELLLSADRLLMIPDFFNWCLCGEKVAEYTNATTTQLVDPLTRDWSSELIRRFDFPRKIFPQIVSPGTRLGTLESSVRERTGLPGLEIIAPATHDTGSAVVGVPAACSGRVDWAYISSGTWSLMGLELTAPVLTQRALDLNLTNEGGVDGTFRLLKNIMGLWLLQQCRRSFEVRGLKSDYAQLVHLASEAPAFRSLIDPDDSRFFSPSDMPEAIRSYCREHGEPEPASEGALLRCALESLALKYKRVLGWLEEVAFVDVAKIHIVGGGSKNDLLNQMTADACQRQVLAGPVEATVLGNLLVQVRAAGELSTLADARDHLRKSVEVKIFEPRTNERERWAEAGARFEKICG